MTALAALLPQEDAINQTLAPLREALSRVHYYPGHDQEGGEERPKIEPSKPIASEEFERWAADEETRRSEPSILMRLLYAHEQERERFDELKSLMNTLDLLRDISVSELRDQAGRLLYRDVIFRPAGLGRERSLSFFQLSGGTRRVLYLLAGLLFDESSVMLIEQPEDGIHPALLYKLIHLLRVNADPTQIFFSSHSPTVLSNLKPQDVRLVVMKDGVTQVRALTEAEVDRAEDYLRREGSLAEYLELIQED
jgi:predicted ATP-dependent endonuclease of OLD family